MKHGSSIVLILMIFPLFLIAQDKSMSLETYDIWNSIEDPLISDNGEWVAYSLVPGKGDSKLILHNNSTGKNVVFPRSKNAQFDKGSSLLSFLITSSQSTLDSLERIKEKTKNYPKDTLGIYHLEDAIFDKIANVDSYKMPKYFGRCIAFKMSASKDTSQLKEENDKNGTALRIFNTGSNKIYNFDYVKQYKWSDKNAKLIIHSTGNDSLRNDALILLDVKNDSQMRLLDQNAEFYNFEFSEDGTQLSFIMDRDTLSEEHSNYELAYWNQSMDTLGILADNMSPFVTDGFEISRYMEPLFSIEGDRLYFGICKNSLVEDSLLLESEKVNLEIWHYEDEFLIPQQKKRLKQDKERSYTILYDTNEEKFTTVNGIGDPNVQINEYLSSKYIISTDQKRYNKERSWLGYGLNDLYLTDLETGDKELLLEGLRGSPKLSPSEKYIYWFSSQDTSYMLYDLSTKELRSLSKGQFYDEISDTPMRPSSSGFAFWTEEDESMYVYDQYDIWKIDPLKGNKRRITEGREDRIRYRYVKIDRDLRQMPADTVILLSVFDEKDKSAGLAKYDMARNILEIIESGDYRYARNIQKAKEADKYLFTKEDFNTFPDLIVSNLDFKDQKKISHANPQQEEYAWGSIELFEWKDYEGQDCDGLLAKPADFDPSNKYPLIINFYERSSDRLNHHRAPYPHRSTINYTYWTNKGYVILNPDVRYKVGYPGQSCYNAVMSALEALLKQGFIDEKRIGLQGHSWGGYQIADLLTRTDVFACAESGAPVVNMTSAYGGIRWGSGLSRMFQYEQTQSRIGASLWEKPELYIENSPLFKIPNITTPVLILHNDQDGAVPWYQGIEFFVAMRRLNKPAWLLNYMDEPHWPVKRQNRLDFNHRLEQFFDHYLMDKPMPEWMKEGISALESKTKLGFGY